MVGLLVSVQRRAKLRRFGSLRANIREKPTPLSLVCRAGRRRELDQELGAGRSGDDHGGHGAERRRAKRGAAERRVLHGRARVVGPWEGCARSEVVARPKRRRFTAEYKLRIVREADCLQGVG